MPEEGLDPHQAEEVHSGDVIPVPSRDTLPMDISPEQHAAKLAEMQHNQDVMAAAGRHARAERPEQMAPTAPPSPDMITSADVPKATEEPTSE